MIDLTESLETLREQAGGDGARMLLSLLGIRLQQMGVWSRASQGMTLRQVLEQHPDICEIRGEEVIFRSGQPSSGFTRRFLRKDLFLAFSVPEEGTRSFLDLETLLIVTAPREGAGFGAPVREEPLRHLEIPAVQQVEIDAFIKEYLGEREPAPVIESILQAGRGWQAAAESLIPGSHRALRLAFNQWVVDHAIAWLEHQEVDVRRFLKVIPASPTRKPARWPAPQDQEAGAEALRERLHQCIDRMTPQELESLNVPARLLLMR
jgi:hypothetical protein